MKMSIYESADVGKFQTEIVERKGLGHPDTLSDALAERMSAAYSKYTLQNFGAILHHNFDKVGLLGGRSYVSLGKGYMTSPIRVLINGRATRQFGDKTIPVDDLLIQTAKDFLKERLSLIDPDNDLVFLNNLSTGSSPGQVETKGEDASASRKKWFAPDSLDDVRELQGLFSNDTSAGCGYWPLSPTEAAVLTIEQRLTGATFQSARPWLGTDIKIMAARTGEDVQITMCIPQIANYVSSIQEYTKNLNEIRTTVLGWLSKLLPNMSAELTLNARDKLDIPELYLTAIGSSIESGDEGLVGRGNRTNGIIPSCRPFSIEGASGKNPVYHVGKLYNLLATEISMGLHQKFGVAAEAYLISQSGRSLQDPWQVMIRTSASVPEAGVRGIVLESLKNVPAMTQKLLSGELTTF